MVTEYEQLLGDMLTERRARLEVLKAKKARKGQMEALMSEIGYIEVELERYRGGLALFRTKQLPKVGRWGRPEGAPASAAGSTS